MCGRTAFALAMVVSTRSSTMTDVIRLRKRARRWLVLRPSLNPALRWRMVKLSFPDNFADGPGFAEPGVSKIHLRYFWYPRSQNRDLGYPFFLTKPRSSRSRWAA